MKTIHQHLKEALPEPYLKLAEKYRRETWDNECPSPSYAVIRGINWYDTDEGKDFWSQVHQWVLYQQRLTELPVLPPIEALNKE